MPIGRFVEYEDASPPLRAVVGVASETNALAEAYKVERDERRYRAARKT